MKSGRIYFQLAVILLFAASFIQTFGRAFIVADYYVNTNAYAKNCVNKTRPKLACNGKCGMLKKLESEGKKDQENPERKTDSKQIILFSTCNNLKATADRAFKNLVPVKVPREIAYNPLDFSFSIFHPPRV